MSQIPNLERAPINLGAVREAAQRELVEVLESIAGKKVLVLDSKVSGPLALIAQPALLKEHGVENLYHLSASPVQSECRNVVYMVRPRMALMKLVAAQVREHPQKNHVVVFLPRRTIVCEKVLEEEGVLGSVVVSDYPLYFIPYEEDVLSLELELAFKEVKADGDRGALWYMARAIAALQSHFGVIPNVKGKGKAAVQVADILGRMQREQNPGDAPSALGIAPEIDTMILLDRQVDLVTPMCWQLTYEGLIDEFLGINNGAVEVLPAVMGAQPPAAGAEAASSAAKKIKLPLNSSDGLFRELRDLNFGAVGPLLRSKATAMKQDYAGMAGGGSEQSVSELKDFVKKLNVLPELTRHTNLAQHISTFTKKPSFLSRLHMEQTLVEGQNFDVSFEYVEEKIHRQENLENVLRLLILLSLTNGGIPKKQFDYLRREFLQSYGFEHIFTLSNLEKAGLLKRQEGKSSWQNIKKGLKLVVEDMDDANPTDIAYVFSGYAPLSVRLVQQALKGGWKTIDEMLKLLPGPTFERKQNTQSDPNFADSAQETSPAPEGEAVGRRTVVLVIFIGGVTYAEISALRFLSLQDGMKYDFIVATTKLINGSSFLQTLMDVVQAPSVSQSAI